jgi:DNA-directed RNA polymerase specialized sigma24 family protein
MTTPMVEDLIRSKARGLSRKRHLKLEYEDLLQDGYYWAISLEKKFPGKPDEWLCKAISNMYKKLLKSSYQRNKIFVSLNELYDIAGGSPEDEYIRKIDEGEEVS